MELLPHHYAELYPLGRQWPVLKAKRLPAACSADAPKQKERFAGFYILSAPHNGTIQLGLNVSCIRL
jgi:hypothetical protein